MSRTNAASLTSPAGGQDGELNLTVRALTLNLNFLQTDIKEIQLHRADDVPSPSLRARRALVEAAEGPRGSRVVGAAAAEDGEQFVGRVQANREPIGCPAAADCGG